MVSTASPAPRPRWHKAFLALLPAILKHAKCAFAYLKPEARAQCRPTYDQIWSLFFRLHRSHRS
jgi:hypothetical protein